MTEACVALLGRRDEPTDAVEEYCTWLARGLAPLGINLELARVPWARTGWRAALADLRRHAPAWAGRVILVQYTALAWSERGFPTRFPGLLRVLRAAGARCVLVFHDAKPYTGARLIDRARRAWQTRVMRSAWALADGVVLTVPLERLTWQPPPSPVPVFLPVGANLPARSGAAVSERDAGAPLTVAVFGVTGGEHAPREVADIALAVNRAAARVSGLRLVVFGRGAEDARMLLETAIDRSRVALEVRGVLPEQEVARTLEAADALLFVRDHISSRRGSAIAGIACGLPVVAYEGAETAAPITDAGVLLAPLGNREALAHALEQVLTDDGLRAVLASRSRQAAEQFFSWKAIAARYADLIRAK
ncbi:MAG: glycosyltransferase [Candidatus Acidiferrales bacterium]|jgi:glycosyltransferase involved in cell wall biosynthesis